MRRTRGGWLHPAEKLRLGELNTERLPSDAAGVSRVAAPGSVWDYLPDQPDIDINTYHRQYDFGDSRDTDTTNVWDETADAGGGINGQGLTPLPWGASDDGHASMLTDDGNFALIQYQEKNVTYYADGLGNTPDLWFAFEAKAPAPGTAEVFIGFSETSADVLAANSFFGFKLADDGYWSLYGNDGAGDSLDEPLYVIPQNDTDMNRFGFHISWEDIGGGASRPYVDVFVNDRQELYSVSATGFLPFLTNIRLSLAMKNIGIGENNTLLLNYIKEIWPK